MNWKSTRQHFETALIWVSAGALALIIWEIREAILLAFGAILAAILLRLFANWISSWTRLSKSISLGVATFAIIALIGFTFWLFGSDLSNQFSQLTRHVQGGIQQLRSLMKHTGGGNFGSNFAQQGTCSPRESRRPYGRLAPTSSFTPIEGYLTAPLIERYFVTIAPALILGGLVTVEFLFATVGLIVAAPMTVAI